MGRQRNGEPSLIRIAAVLVLIVVLLGAFRAGWFTALGQGFFNWVHDGMMQIPRDAEARREATHKSAAKQSPSGDSR